MTRDTMLHPVEAAAPVPSATGTVLHGVMMGRDLRSPVRPRTGASATPLPRPADRATLPVVVPAAAQEAVEDSAALRQRADPDEELVAYQERGRGFRAGYEEGRQQGHAEGLQEGRQQGHAEGLQLAQTQGRDEGYPIGVEEGRVAGQQEASVEQAAAKQALAERLSRLDALVASLPAQIDRRLGDAEEEMLGLCFEAVARIMGEAAASSEGVRAIVRQAVAELKSNEAATIRVNPADLAFLKGDEELAAWLGSNRRVRWLDDERIELGGCLIATPEGGLDARLETQMARLAVVFAKARQEKGQ